MRNLLYSKKTIFRSSSLITLKDGATTTIHVVRYNRKSIKPRIVLFDKGTYLVDWCQDNGVTEAMVGANFLRSTDEAIGDTWIKGVQQKTLPTMDGWGKVRGCIYISNKGEITLSRRYLLPEKPENYLLQAGPLLVVDGEVQIVEGQDPEGFSATQVQYDQDITVGRHPRSAIGISNQYVWSVVCDGRSDLDAGMTLLEMAEFMKSLGAQDALNLDGGGSASQVSGGIMRNHARGDDIEYPKGRPLYTAVLFD